jgi:cobalt-zinc-cadmium efflux system outer membrane protein
LNDNAQLACAGARLSVESRAVERKDFVMALSHQRKTILGHRRTLWVLAGLAMILAVARPARALTLADAVEAAIAANPELAALEHEKHALDAAVEQARLLPNPEFQAEVENVAGDGARKGDDAAETTLRFTQQLELGGKRSARTRAATSAAAVAAADLELRRLEVTAAVKSAFAAALAAQKRVALAKDLEQLAQEAARSVGSAVGAGATSAVERDRAKLVLAKADRERVLRERQAANARRALATMWGAANPDFEELEGSLETGVAMPARDAIFSEEKDDHPEIRRADMRIAERMAAVSLEKANRIPDLTVAAGGRHFNDEDDLAAVFSVTTPLPLFDRNQVALAKAEARLAQAREQRRSADLALRASLSAAYDRYTSAEEQRVLIDERVLPAASRAVDAAAAAHRDGRFPYHEVLDARRTLYELRADRIDVLEERLLATVEVERFAGVVLIDAWKRELR